MWAIPMSMHNVNKNIKDWLLLNSLNHLWLSHFLFTFKLFLKEMSYYLGYRPVINQI